MTVNGTQIENVESFVYLGALQQGDGDVKADVKHLWKDRRLPLSMKLRLYLACVCSTFTLPTKLGQMLLSARSTVSTIFASIR